MSKSRLSQTHTDSAMTTSFPSSLSPSEFDPNSSSPCGSPTAPPSEVTEAAQLQASITVRPSVMLKDLLPPLDDREIFAVEHPSEAQWLPPPDFTFTPRCRSSALCEETTLPSRPPNAFLLFRSRVGSEKLVHGEPQQNVSRVASELWKTMSPGVKRAWRAQAQRVREQYAKDFPAGPRMHKVKVVKNAAVRKRRPRSPAAEPTHTIRTGEPLHRSTALPSPPQESAYPASESSMSRDEPPLVESQQMTGALLDSDPFSAYPAPVQIAQYSEPANRIRLVGTGDCPTCLVNAMTSFEDVPCSGCRTQSVSEFSMDAVSMPQEQLAAAFGIMWGLPLSQDLQVEVGTLFARISDHLASNSSGVATNADI